MGKLRYFLLALACVLSIGTYAQDDRFFMPGQDAPVIYGAAAQRSLERASDYAKNAAYQKSNDSLRYEGDDVLVIPVVFHILATNKDVDTDPFNVETDDRISSNLSRHKIEQLLKYVNSRLRNEYLDKSYYTPSAGAPGTIEEQNNWYNQNVDFVNSDVSPIWAAEEVPSSVDIGVEFRLATVDPDGNPTTGIVRHDMSDNPAYMLWGVTQPNYFGGLEGFDPLDVSTGGSADFQSSLINRDFARRRALRDSLQTLGIPTTGSEIMRSTGWPSKYYMNIWVAHEIDNLGILCATPSLCLINTFSYDGDISEDETQYGLVYPSAKLSNYGFTADVATTSKDMMGGLAHYFGLLPTYTGYETCEDLAMYTDPLYGDGVADTKPTTKNAGCGIRVVDCSTTGCEFEDYVGGVPDFQNYMDGSSCARRFTPGQADRWRSDILLNKPSLVNNRWEPLNNSNVNVDLSVRRSGYYTYEPKVLLKNTGNQIINNYTITVSIDGTSIQAVYSQADLGPIYPDEDFVVTFPDFQLTQIDNNYTMTATFSSDEDDVAADNVSQYSFTKVRDLELTTNIRSRNYNPNWKSDPLDQERYRYNILRTKPFIWVQNYTTDTNYYALRSYIAPYGNVGGYQQNILDITRPFKIFSNTTYGIGIDKALQASDYPTSRLDYPSNPPEIANAYRDYYENKNWFIQRDQSLQINTEESIYIPPGTWEVNIMSGSLSRPDGAPSFLYQDPHVARVGALFNFFKECQDPDAPIYRNVPATGNGGISENIDPDDCFLDISANDDEIFRLDATNFNIPTVCFNPNLSTYAFNSDYPDHDEYQEWLRKCNTAGGVGDIISNWQAGLSLWDDSLMTYVINNENPDGPYRYSIRSIINTEDYSIPALNTCLTNGSNGDGVCPGTSTALNPSFNIVEVEFNPPNLSTIKLGVSVVDMGYVDSDYISFEVSEDPTFATGVETQNVLLNKSNKLTGAGTVWSTSGTTVRKSRTYDSNQPVDSPNPSTYVEFDSLDLNNTHYYRISLGERLLFQGEKDYVGSCPGLTQEYNGVVYELTSIGNQCWFKRELATDKFSNGDDIELAGPYTQVPSNTEERYQFADMPESYYFPEGELFASLAAKGITLPQDVLTFLQDNLPQSGDLYAGIWDNMTTEAPSIEWLKEVFELKKLGQFPHGFYVANSNPSDPATGTWSYVVGDSTAQAHEWVEMHDIDEWVESTLDDITVPIFKIPHESYFDLLSTEETVNYYEENGFGTGQPGDEAFTEQQYNWFREYNEYDSLKYSDRGYLYNYATVVDPRGVCPTGWRVPSHHDVQELYDYAAFGDMSLYYKVLQDENPANNWNSTTGEPQLYSFSRYQGWDSYNFDFKPFPQLDLTTWMFRPKSGRHGSRQSEDPNGVVYYNPTADNSWWGTESDTLDDYFLSYIRGGGSDLLETNGYSSQVGFQRWVADPEKPGDILTHISTYDSDPDESFYQNANYNHSGKHGMWLWDMSWDAISKADWFDLSSVRSPGAGGNIDSLLARTGPVKLQLQNTAGLKRYQSGGVLHPQLENGIPEYTSTSTQLVDPPHILPDNFWDNGPLGMLNIPDPVVGTQFPNVVRYSSISGNDTIFGWGIPGGVSSYEVGDAHDLWKQSAIGRGIRCVQGGNEVDHTQIVGNQVSQVVEGEVSGGQYNRLRASCSFDVTANIHDGERPLVWDQCENCQEQSQTISDVFCDCEGHVYDALGYCGGSCLYDWNNDGVCDSQGTLSVASPCDGLTSVEYGFYDYDIVEIGSQCWFAENLKTVFLNDGNSITSASTDSQWKNSNSANQPAYSSYDNNASNAQAFGYLYNWYAVETGELCPSGWHVPSDDDWKDLERTLGMAEDEVVRLSKRGGSSLAGTQLKAGGVSNLDLLLGGLRVGRSGNFKQLGSSGYYWTSTSKNDRRPSRNDNAIHRAVGDNVDGIMRYSDSWSTLDTKHHGLSVRCIKD